MPRIRSIKPDFYSDPDLGRLSLESRYLYQSLWVFSDDYGRQAGDQRLIKSQSFPFDDRISVKKIERLLEELESAGKVLPYEVDGIRYLYLPNFRTHQRIDKVQDPKHPVPPPDLSPNIPRTEEEHSYVDRKGGDLIGGDNPPLTPPGGGTKGARANGTNPRAVAKLAQAQTLQDSILDCSTAWCNGKTKICDRCAGLQAKIRELEVAS